MDQIQHSKPVPPFVKFCAANIPMVFDDSLSYYEALCALSKWLQTNVIDVINNNASVTEDYIEYDLETRQLFIQLKDFVDNYFDNLDVQEEINNKLDDMVEDGTLQEIITTYIQSNVAWTFDTVADMKLATNLVDGSFARTLGFNSLNDGGGATYKIKNTGTADEMGVIAIGDLYAHVVVTNSMCFEQFGAYGDGVHYDQDYMNAALSSGASIINGTEGKTYNIKGFETGQSDDNTPQALAGVSGLVIPSNVTVDFHNATLVILPNNRKIYNAITINNVHDATVKNVNIVGDVEDHSEVLTGEWGYGVSIRNGSNRISLDNVKASKCWGDGLNIAGYTNDGLDLATNTNLHITNCTFDDNRRQGMSLSSAENVLIESTKFINTGTTANASPSAGVDIEAGYWPQMIMHNIEFKDCEFSGNYGCGISVLDDHDYQCINGVIIDSCVIKGNLGNHSSVCGAYINRAKNVKIINSVIDRGSSTMFSNTFYLDDGCEVINNTFNNTIILFNATRLNKSKFVIEGNTFNIDADDIQYNTAIYGSNYDGANTGNTLIVKDNKFIRSFAKKDTTFLGWIRLYNTTGFTKLICDGNYFQFGDYHVQSKIPAIIKNNNFVGSRYPSIQLNGATDYVQIDNNVFEQTSWYGNYVGIINTETTNKIVLVNNTNYSRMLNTGLAFEPTRIPTRWHQFEPTTWTNQNNYLIDNSQ